MNLDVGQVLEANDKIKKFKGYALIFKTVLQSYSIRFNLGATLYFFIVYLIKTYVTKSD